MILFCGVVVGESGLDFVFEIADGNGFAVSGDSDGPSFFSFVPRDAFVF